MSVKIGSEIKFVGETFKLEAVEKWSDLTEYYAYSFHDGKIVKTYVGSNFSMGDDCVLDDVEVDVTPEVKAKLKAFERREERTKKARARREYNQYAWREAKELGLHRAEYEAIRLKVDYNFRRLVKMLRELASRGEIEKVGYSGMVAEIFGIVARHDLDALVSIGNDPHNSLTFSRMTRYAEKALYGDY